MLVSLLVVSGLLAGCSSDSPQEQRVDEQALLFGNATPADSPAAPAANPVQLNSSLTTALGGSPVALHSVKNTLIVQGPRGIAVGDLAAITDGTADVVAISQSCGPIAVAPTTTAFPAGAVTISCPTDDAAASATVTIYPLDKLDSPLTATVASAINRATLTSEDSLVVGSDADTQLTVYPVASSGIAVDDGKTIKLDQVSDSLVAVPAADYLDGVVSVNDEKSKIGGVSLAEHDAAYLRGGRGIAQLIAAGDNTIAATDQRNNQLMVFTSSPLIMLHQTQTTGKSPWAVAWDEQAQLIYVSTTADNMLSSYDIHQGVPSLVGQVPTAADIRSVVVVGDNVVTLSANGTLDVLSADALATLRGE
ncbi:hypothetical protein CCHOA_05900 [Corynebacterium choanae]|uniref:Prolipoprotein LppL n=3 Tax=Corynebacterium choanae TaxID=1862358 RepID=A0A3G6JAR7_9CORY|nr:hypothetical protein CCHOA_05900 [Corynebacterium choanae]